MNHDSGLKEHKAESISGKQRMLNSYRGVFSDRYPVAPEFWYYYPAKVMGVDMIEFERDVPLWHALQVTFKQFGTEGWGVVGASPQPQDTQISESFVAAGPGQYSLTVEERYKGKLFTSKRMFDPAEPSWAVEHPVKDPCDLADYLAIYFSCGGQYDFAAARNAYDKVGEDYLLELVLAGPFFDVVAGAMGFENAVVYFATANPAELEHLQSQYVESQLAFIRQACEQTTFESFFLGCSFSCNSLIGPVMWRRWDKPCIKTLADELHKHGRHLHIHFHGRCMETVADFAEIGLDCVCPFERPPGGDIVGQEGLAHVRRTLAGQVTMNGNVHTVETLIRGKPAAVRAEVRQIKAAFAGEPRLIIGTGDQVGLETPEENIHAMVEEAKSD